MLHTRLPNTGQLTLLSPATCNLGISANLLALGFRQLMFGQSGTWATLRRAHSDSMGTRRLSGLGFRVPMLSRRLQKVKPKSPLLGPGDSAGRLKGIPPALSVLASSQSRVIIREGAPDLTNSNKLIKKTRYNANSILVVYGSRNVWY